MGISILKQNEGIKQLSKLYFEKKLIPVFGSGFTMGCKSSNGIVPDGKKATEIMRGLLLTNNTEITPDELQNLDFNKMAKHFLDLAPPEIRNEFFINYFSGVNIEGNKKELLNFSWPYAYTINVDDGIENSSSFKVILPYKGLNKPHTSIKLLYKLHGDAFSEASSKTEKSIVFSSEQYVNSLTDENNKEMLNNLCIDYADSNLIFIGCSLMNEPDLSFIYSKVKADSRNNLRILLRTKEPRTITEKNLLLSYGINEIIIIDDYDIFYQDLISELKRLEIEEQVELFRYKNPFIEWRTSKEDTNKYLSDSRIFDEGNNTFYLCGMHILRNATIEIENQLNQSNCIILKGRRFSGKTILLSFLCSRNPKYTVYFFPSSSLYDEQLVYKLMSECENSLFVFDSNSVSSDTYRLIAHSNTLLEEKGNKVIMATNSNDNHLVESLKSGLVEISSFFQGKELELNKIAADKYGLVKRSYRQTNLDYLQMLSTEQKIRIPLLSQFPRDIIFEEQILFILLAISDKVFLGDALAMGISFSIIDKFLERFYGVVEEIPTDANEKTTHSTRKIVHNSKIFVLNLIRELKHNEIKRCIIHIVKSTRNDRQRHRICIETILFDTLNQLFGGRQGAGHFIFEVYQELQDYLNYDLHYWLQRAKSIYRILPYDIEHLLNAYKYAKKVYIEGYNKLQMQAALSISLISCLLYNLEIDNMQKRVYQTEAIVYAYEAIFSEYYRFNTRHLKSELKTTSRQKSYLDILKSLCLDVINNNSNDDLAKKAKEISDKLEAILSINI